MNDRVAELAAEGRTLSPDERMRLLALLIDSLREDACTVDAAWVAEIERRVASYERGDGELFEVDDVMRDAARIAP